MKSHLLMIWLTLISFFLSGCIFESENGGDRAFIFIKTQSEPYNNTINWDLIETMDRPEDLNAMIERASQEGDFIQEISATQGTDWFNYLSNRPEMPEAMNRDGFQIQFEGKFYLVAINWL